MGGIVTADELQDQPKDSGRRSYWPGICFIVAAAVAKVIGMVMAGSSLGSARSSGSFFEAGSQLEQAAYIEGASSVVMAILGLIGIILVIRAAIGRSRA